LNKTDYQFIDEGELVITEAMLDEYSRVLRLRNKGNSFYPLNVHMRCERCCVPFKEGEKAYARAGAIGWTQVYHPQCKGKPQDGTLSKDGTDRCVEKSWYFLENAIMYGWSNSRIIKDLQSSHNVSYPTAKKILSRFISQYSAKQKVRIYAVDGDRRGAGRPSTVYVMEKIV